MQMLTPLAALKLRTRNRLVGTSGNAAACSVSAQPAGREVRYGVDPQQFARALAQLAVVGQAWDGRLRRIKAIAETIEKAKKPR